LESLSAVPYPGLEALPEAYARVFRDGGDTSFFLRRDWFHNFIETVVQDPRRIRVYGVESGTGVPVAALPMLRTYQTGSTLSPARLDGLTNYYSTYFAPVIASGGDVAAVARALAARLWKDRREWDVIALQPLERGAAAFDDLVRALRDAGIVTQTYFCFGNWYLEVAGRSYLEYLESLSSVLRKNIPYNIRRLEKSKQARIELIVGDAGLDRALDDYEKVYNSSWKVPEPFPRFIPGLARVAARSGGLRLGLIYIDGEPAAAQLWIVNAGVASIYKIAYDERYAKLSVGTVLTAKLMQHVIDVDHVRIVDYLSGDDDYKRMWMSHRREFWGILAFNPRSLRGLAQIVRHVGGRLGKRTLRRITSRSTRA
jgi:CelD/BcsL family acetyltransferase involved in cellulose biosynthesis